MKIAASTATPPTGRQIFLQLSYPDVRPLGWLRILADLTKFWIALLSTASATAGYLVFSQRLAPDIFPATGGVLLLAMGACAMNHFQDRHLDARMRRTRHRPIPSGLLSPIAAFAFAMFLLSAGALLLWQWCGMTVVFIGWIAVAWYNLVYTYLKRVWAFAVVPGALIGALPPVIGWTAAGGDPLEIRALVLAFFFFIWQVPHFWLLLFRFGEDYERAGLPSLTRVFSAGQLARLTFVWMLTTAVSSLLLALFLLTSSMWINFGLVVSGFWLVWKSSKLLRKSQQPDFLPVFRAINYYALGIMVLLAIDALVL